MKEGIQKRARRDDCSCRNDAVDSALERWGLGASFEGYCTFVTDLDVALSEVKEHAQPYAAHLLWGYYTFVEVKEARTTINSKFSNFFIARYYKVPQQKVGQCELWSHAPPPLTHTGKQWKFSEEHFVGFSKIWLKKKGGGAEVRWIFNLY